VTSFIVEAGIIGWLALIATRGTPSPPIRSTTTLIDEIGTWARAKRRHDGGRKRTGRDGDALDFRLLRPCVFRRLISGLPPFEPPPPAGLNRARLIAKVKVAAAITRVAAVRQRLARGIFPVEKGCSIHVVGS